MAKDETLSMSKSDLKELLGDINKEYQAKLESATNEIERLKATLEMQDRQRNAIKKNDRPEGLPKVQVLGSFAPIDHQGMLAKPFIEKNKDRYYRFINSRPDAASLRKAQGFEPVLDQKGGEVRYHDSILASMPRRAFEETIVKPVQQLREHKRNAIQHQFESEAEKAHVEVFGKVTYDKGESNE
jgi:hypothetical protein